MSNNSNDSSHSLNTLCNFVSNFFDQLKLDTKSDGIPASNQIAIFTFHQAAFLLIVQSIRR
jgi:hypothetical protein